MLASQEKVLSPGNEGSMAVTVYNSIFPGLSSLVQFLYMPATVRRLVC